MKCAPFIHHAPTSVEKAVALLAEFRDEDARILAGGQSLVPTMAYRLARPTHLVDINNIASLQRIATEGDHLVIGAGVRHSAFKTPVLDGPLGRLLATVMRSIAHYPIRTRGTFCGSLAHADPSSEWCLVAATLDAEIDALGAEGARRIAAADFFEGPMMTTLAEVEMIVGVRLPLLPDRARFGFHEVSRRAGDYAMAAALVVFEQEGGMLRNVRIGLGGAEDRPRRNAAAEAVLEGAAPSLDLFRHAADAAAETIEPLEDLQADAGFRRDLVRSVLRRALAQALEPVAA